MRKELKKAGEFLSHAGEFVEKVLSDENVPEQVRSKLKGVSETIGGLIGEVEEARNTFVR